MLRLLTLAAFMILVAASAFAARPLIGEEEVVTPPGSSLALALLAPGSVVAEPGCGDAALDAAPHTAPIELCTLGVEDEAWLAANLLVGKLGNAASEFAQAHAIRSAAEDDAIAAELWTRISAMTAELLRRR
jgi:hypothetical protein